MIEENAILRHLERLPHARASFKQLVRELGAKGASRTELESALKRLVRRGALIEFRPGHFVSAARTREYVTGRLHRHREGYGFIIADRPLEGVDGDIFLPPAAAEKAMHGDRVVARITRVDRVGRAEGEIVHILQRAHPTVVGEFRIRRNGYFLIPHDERLRDWIEIPPELALPEPSLGTHRMAVSAPGVQSAEELDGMIVDVELLAYPKDGERAVGRVIEVLGYPEDFGVDVEIIIRKHHLPHRFPPEVLEQAQSLPSAVRAHELAGRVDFRGMDVVTIDGETARDFDDAVWVDRLPNGHYALHVHIADVSHYVAPGTPIDEEAYRRGTSVYFPDRAVPMLPLELSAELCSLKPHSDRLTLSVLLEIDHRGDVIAQEFVKGVIRSAARLTYTEVHAALEGDPAARERWAHLLERFERMRELALILNRKRARRGSIDFDLPEPFIEFDEWGEMTGIRRAPRNIAHRIIEEFMLAANEAVATHLETRGVPSLYRIHEPPDPQKVVEFEEIAAHFGYSLGLGALPVKRFAVVDRKRDGRKIRKDVIRADERLEVSSRQYQRLVEKIQGKPEERILSYLMLRSLKQARYSPENTGHFALATDTYTHFTSPIRRYPDLVVHRILSALLDGRQPPAMDLPAIAAHASETERRAAEAERELVEWKKVKFMAERLGDEFDALIISTSKLGFFVELIDLFMEGLVPIEVLPGERYRYLDNARQIVGERTRRRFAVGDRVRVRLDRVDGVERRLYFSLAEPARGRRWG
ncbi:MAG: VacB/RNase II family 3'-5' exoribonuclease [Bryobacterales bacterium]|nr:VacB/RNase II family 3'-5' exoribonuclease [Bryobacteraceae bacterium]MDW8354225.1 VacB/RNase II family 3'-5' exoribonuclease [Bryobacterales bacterium]